jgi:hypothetical protein
MNERIRHQLYTRLAKVFGKHIDEHWSELVYQAHKQDGFLSWWPAFAVGEFCISVRSDCIEIAVPEGTTPNGDPVSRIIAFINYAHPDVIGEIQRITHITANRSILTAPTAEHDMRIKA